MRDATAGDPIALIRERLRSLAASHAAGTLDDAAYEAARRDAERALGDAVLAGAPPAPPDDATAVHAVRSPTRPSTQLIATIVVAVVAVAIGGYALTGSPSLAGLGVPPPPAAAVAGAGQNGAAPADGQREAGLREIAGMVDQLAERLKTRPDDAEGWTMLARSYTVLARYREALPAYQHAVALQPKNAGLLADYADATAAANGGKANAESTALIERALAIDPSQPKALALAGTIAFDRGDFPGAIAQWQKIADALPPDSEFHQQVIANIDEARRRGGLPPTPKSAASASPASPAPQAAAAAGGAEALTGVVTLAPSVAAEAAPGDTVFVLARAEGARMPLAVVRATVRDLPLRFKLDDSMAMTPTMKISDMKQVVVAARVSKSGNAISQPGDLSGESRPVAPGTGNLEITIGTVVR